MKARTIVAGLSIVAVIAAVVAGFLSLDPPSVERTRRIDQRRQEDLAVIAGRIDAHFSDHSALPATLDELAAKFGGTMLRDPGTGAAYEYTALDERRYQLCAVFELPYLDKAPYLERWAHGAGRQCFELTPTVRRE